MVEALALSAVFAVAAGVAALLARLLARWAAVMLLAGSTVVLIPLVWLTTYQAFEPVETDEAGVASVITAVAALAWVLGALAGYRIGRPR